MNHPEKVSDSAKVWLFERLIKNLYHSRGGIEYRFHNINEENMNSNHGFITIKDVDIDQMPNICDVCDEGLSQNIEASVVPDEFRKEFYEEDAVTGAIDVDIWFNFNPYVEIDRLKSILSKDKQEISENA